MELRDADQVENNPGLGFVVLFRDIRDFVQRHAVFIVVFQQIVLYIDIRLVAFFQNFIGLVDKLDFFLGRFFGLFGNRHPHFAPCVEINDIARVGADDWRLVQVIKPFAGGWTKAFCSPFFLGHGHSLSIGWRGLVKMASTATTPPHCQRLSSPHLPDRFRTSETWVSRGILSLKLVRNSDMGQAVLSGDPPVEITLRRSARARRVSLRVSGLDGRVTLSLPKGMDTAEALAFAEEKSDWIRKHLAGHGNAVDVRLGGKILVRGEEVAIVAGPVRKAELAEGALVVPNRPDMAPARIKAFLKIAARHELAQACAAYANRVERKIGKISLRDTRSRWGSCSAHGALMFSWRLVMAPPDVLDYVAAHEVAHLAELNHSPAYWAVVERICPGYATPRQWLRQNGQLLHRYRFGD